jgi:hypothetical protein
VKLVSYSLFLLCALALSNTGNAAGSMLRVACDGNAVGAVVSIDGKFKGECPIDLQMKAGQFTLTAVKTINGKKESFTQSIRLGDDVVKRVEVLFGNASEPVSGAPIPVDMKAVASQRYEAELAEYNRSIQACLPKYGVELRRITQAIRADYKEKWNECKQRALDGPGASGIDVMCGSSSPSSTDEMLNSGWISSSVKEDFYKFSDHTEKSWCARQFTAPKIPQ